METEETKPSNPDFQKGANPMLQDRVTLRDYFAAKAMQAFIANGSYQKSSVRLGAKENIEQLSKASYDIAEGMLKHREL